MISTKKENPAFSLPGSRAPQIVKITELVFLDWGMRLLSISLDPCSMLAGPDSTT